MTEEDEITVEGVSSDAPTERVRAVTGLIAQLDATKNPDLIQAGLLIIERIVDSIPTATKAPVISTFLGKRTVISVEEGNGG